jgi:hypothetical protein
MGTNEVIIGLACLTALCGWITYRSLRTINRLDRYERENTTEGGVVNFETNRDAVRHKNKRLGAESLMKLGCLFTFLSGAAFLIIFFFGIR